VDTVHYVILPPEATALFWASYAKNSGGYLDDPERTARLIREAEVSGFQFDD